MCKVSCTRLMYVLMICSLNVPSVQSHVLFFGETEVVVGYLYVIFSTLNKNLTRELR